MSKAKTILVWFRNDLRLHDNEVLNNALKATKKTKDVKVLPFYCFDTRVFQGTSRVAKIPRISPLRAQFLLESVTDLKNKIETLTCEKEQVSSLLLRAGIPDVEIEKIVSDFNVQKVLGSKEACSEETKDEKAIEQKLKKLGVSVEWLWTHTMVHIDDLPYDNVKSVSSVFTPFKKKLEKGGQLPDLVKKPIPEPDATTKESWFQVPREEKDKVFGVLPTLKQLFNDEKVETPVVDKRTVFPFKGGETEALKRMKDYLWDSSLLKKYHQTRNELLGVNYSSKLSAWLAHGCLSPRLLYHQVLEYQEKNGTNDATTTFISELIWRDFYRFLAMRFGDNIFFKKGIQLSRTPRYEWKANEELFQKWAQGKTGYPFIDANMRELRTTGWMSNRGRQVVASFLAKDMQIDWRMGAEFFEMMLLDFDVTSNWCNWNWAAGVGCDPRSRYFNPLKQSVDFDSNAKYIKTWVPELTKVPGSKEYEYAAHFPMILTESEKKRYGCESYPSPSCVVKAPSVLSAKLRTKVDLAIIKHTPASAPKPLEKPSKKAASTSDKRGTKRKRTKNDEEEDDDDDVDE